MVQETKIAMYYHLCADSAVHVLPFVPNFFTAFFGKKYEDHDFAFKHFLIFYYISLYVNNSNKQNKLPRTTIRKEKIGNEVQNETLSSLSSFFLFDLSFVYVALQSLDSGNFLTLFFALPC